MDSISTVNILPQVGSTLSSQLSLYSDLYHTLGQLPHRPHHRYIRSLVHPSRPALRICLHVHLWSSIHLGRTLELRKIPLSFDAIPTIPLGRRSPLPMYGCRPPIPAFQKSHTAHSAGGRISRTDCIQSERFIIGISLLHPVGHSDR